MGQVAKVDDAAVAEERRRKKWLRELFVERAAHYIGDSKKYNYNL